MYEGMVTNIPFTAELPPSIGATVLIWSIYENDAVVVGGFLRTS